MYFYFAIWSIVDIAAIYLPRQHVQKGSVSPSTSPPVDNLCNETEALGNRQREPQKGENNA